MTKMTLNALTTRGGMTEVQALNYMHRARQTAIKDNRKVVRILRDGKVVEQMIGG